MRHLLLAAASALLTACAGVPAADPSSDAPERHYTGSVPVVPAASYEEALTKWRTPEHVNAWIGARFRYDMARAMQLSETQRSRGGRMPIHAPAAFFGAPDGVCVDLARFAVETLREIAPETKPRYVMIEFDPVTLAGNTLRRHWVAGYEREGQLWFFADSRRPGHVAGPYASTQAYLDDYARYRGRGIVAHSERDSYERRLRTSASRQERAPAQ